MIPQLNTSLPEFVRVFHGDCPICLEDTEIPEGTKELDPALYYGRKFTVVVLPCGHPYHRWCLLPMFEHAIESQRQCAKCKTALPESYRARTLPPPLSHRIRAAYDLGCQNAPNEMGHFGVFAIPTALSILIPLSSATLEGFTNTLYWNHMAAIAGHSNHLTNMLSLGLGGGRAIHGVLESQRFSRDLIAQHPGMSPESRAVVNLCSNTVYGSRTFMTFGTLFAVAGVARTPGFTTATLTSYLAVRLLRAQPEQALAIAAIGCVCFTYLNETVLLAQNIENSLHPYAQTLVYYVAIRILFQKVDDFYAAFQQPMHAVITSSTSRMIVPCMQRGFTVGARVGTWRAMRKIVGCFKVVEEIVNDALRVLNKCRRAQRPQAN